MTELVDPFTSCIEKQNTLKLEFANCLTQDAKYQKIISLGVSLPPLALQLKIPQARVPGCQSALYLHSRLIDGNIYFSASSEALISAGLAALLLHVYNGEEPETVLKCPPTFLEELGIPASLSPNRSNGLASLFLRMRQEALKCLTNP